MQVILRGFRFVGQQLGRVRRLLCLTQHPAQPGNSDEDKLMEPCTTGGLQERSKSMAGTSAARLSDEDLARLKERVFTAARIGDLQEMNSALSGLTPDLVSQLLHQTSCDEVAVGLYWSEQYRGTPLAMAAAHGHLNMVRLLVEVYGANINFEEYLEEGSEHILGLCDDRMASLHCPLRLNFLTSKPALFAAQATGQTNVVRYLVEKGADLEKRYDCGRTFFLEVCHSSVHLMARYLVKHGADINKTDWHGRTALHLAALKDATAIAKLLLAHRATVSRDANGRTPLMTAVLHGSCGVVDCLAQSPAFSREEKIQAFELLGAGLIWTDETKAFKYLSSALDERYGSPRHVVPKPVSALPVLRHLQESSSHEELRRRKLEPGVLQLECLAVLQRMLGLQDMRVCESFIKCCSLLMRHQKLGDAMALILHFGRCVGEASGDILEKYFQALLWTLENLLGHEVVPPIPDTLQALQAARERIQRDEELFIPLQTRQKLADLSLLCVLACMKNTPDLQEGSPVQELVVSLLRFCRAISAGWYMMHAAVSLRWKGNIGKLVWEDLPYVGLVNCLLQYGADPNAANDEGDRPLHVIARFPETEDNHDTLSSITRLLVEAGALVGAQKRDGRTSMDLAVSSTVKSILQEHLPLSLQSLAALAVLKGKVPYHSEVSEDLANFVRKHCGE